METGIQHIVDKLERAVLALADGAVIKQVGVNSQSQNTPSKQSKSKTNHRCSYCSGEHLAHECTKYKSVQSRKDRVLQLRLCFSCLTPGHSSKMCRSTKTCRSCSASYHSLTSIRVTFLIMYCQMQHLMSAIATSKRMYEPSLTQAPTVALLVLM